MTPLLGRRTLRDEQRGQAREAWRVAQRVAVSGPRTCACWEKVAVCGPHIPYSCG